MRIELGDAALDINLHVYGLRRYRLVWHVGAPRDTSPADRIVKGPPYGPTPRKVDLVMDLQADKQVEVDVQFTDEVGNEVDNPGDASVSYTTDNPTVLNVTDHGDGTATVAATGQLGSANVHVSVSSPSLGSLTGDLGVTVVAGLAERVNIVAGEPTEVTPDEEPAPEPV
jgi:hypothetical protein